MAARQLTPGGETPREHQSIVERLAAEAIRVGADLLDIECKDGQEWVFATKGGVGYSITSFRSSSPEAMALREELHRLTRRKQRIAVRGSQYELRGSVHESFGEDAFRVRLRRV